MRFNWFNQWSVQRKLIISNLLMLVIPFFVLSITLCSIWGILRYTNPVSHRDWMMLAPSTIQSQVFQLGLEQINKKLARSSTTVSDILDSSAVLEAQGMDIVILKDDQVAYFTPGSDASRMLLDFNATGHIVSASVHHLDWHGNQITYVNSYGNGLAVLGSGQIPFMAKSMGKETTEKKAVEGAFGLGIFIVLLIIISFGLYFSIRLARYILLPIRDLKRAADSIKDGLIPEPIKIRNNDELGVTCEAFNNMQQSLVEAHEEQQIYEERRREMIAGICHDISTPLTSVKGYASGILEGVANTDEKRARYVQMIYDMAGRIERLVNMLSDFSKLELKQIHYDLHIYNIDNLVREYVTDRHLEDTDHIILRESYHTDGGLINVDRLQFQRILDNLLSNSIKYRRGDTVYIDVETSIIDTGYRLTISDNGEGVSTEMLGRIFDIFFRTDEARTEVTNGNGIGLAIVKQIVEDMNGTIWAVHNPEGQGLSIVIEFPKAKE